MYFFSFKIMSLLVFYLPLQSDFSCFIIAAGDSYMLWLY